MKILSLIILLSVVLSYGQDGSKTIVPIKVNQRVALVIGNGGYLAQPAIPQSLNDADDVAARLRALQFQVNLVKNAQIGDLDRHLDAFYRNIQPESLALFYYSGHGGSLSEENYLLPIEYQQQETESGVERNAVAVSKVRDQMEKRGARVRVLIFDACRSVSLMAAKGGAAGLAQMHGKPEGTLIAYASAHGQVSRFNPSDRNSYYTSALLGRLSQPNADLFAILNETAENVYLQSGKSQMPYFDGRLFGKLYLAGVPADAPSAAASPDRVLYDEIKGSNDPAALEAAAAKMQDSKLAGVLRARAQTTRESAMAAGPATTPAKPNTPPNPNLIALNIASFAGLHAGDTYEKAISLYGKPTKQKEGALLFGKLIRSAEVTNFMIEFDPSTHKITHVIVFDSEAGTVARVAGMSRALALFGKSKQELLQMLGPPQHQRSDLDYMVWVNGEMGLTVSMLGGSVRSISTTWPAN